MDEIKRLEKQLYKLKEAYKQIFNSDEGKEVLSDLEKDVTIIRPPM